MPWKGPVANVNEMCYRAIIWNCCCFYFSDSYLKYFWCLSVTLKWCTTMCLPIKDDFNTKNCSKNSLDTPSSWWQKVIQHACLGHRNEYCIIKIHIFSSPFTALTSSLKKLNVCIKLNLIRRLVIISHGEAE